MADEDPRLILARYPRWYDWRIYADYHPGRWSYSPMSGFTRCTGDDAVLRLSLSIAGVCVRSDGQPFVGSAILLLKPVLVQLKMMLVAARQPGGTKAESAVKHFRCLRAMRIANDLEPYVRKIIAAQMPAAGSRRDGGSRRKFRMALVVDFGH